jgi:hypothetical protein
MISGSTLNADFGRRPNRLPGVDLYAGAHTRDHSFNVAAFAPPPACCVWGNARALNIYAQIGEEPKKVAAA